MAGWQSAVSPAQADGVAEREKTLMGLALYGQMDEQRQKQERHNTWPCPSVLLQAGGK